MVSYGTYEICKCNDREVVKMELPSYVTKGKTKKHEIFKAHKTACLLLLTNNHFVKNKNKEKETLLTINKFI